MPEEIVKSALLRSILSHELGRMSQDPLRALRALVDLTQLYIPTPASKLERMLKSPKSAYVALAKRLADTANHEHIKTFCINALYHGYARAQKTLADWEKALGCSLPGMFAISPLGADSQQLASLIAQAQALGAAVFAFQGEGCLASASLHVYQNYPRCAFTIEAPADAVDEELCQTLLTLPNVAPLLRGEEGALAKATALLQKYRLPYGLLATYSSRAEAAQALHPDALAQIERLAPALYVLCPAGDAKGGDIFRVRHLVRALRHAQKYPFVPMSLPMDGMPAALFAHIAPAKGELTLHRSGVKTAPLPYDGKLADSLKNGFIQAFSLTKEVPPCEF